MRELCVDELKATNGGLCEEVFDVGTVVTAAGCFVAGAGIGASAGPGGALLGAAGGGILGLIAPQLVKSIVCPG